MPGSLVLRIVSPVVFSFLLWSPIWLLTAGGPGPSFEIVHVTRPFIGLPGFLLLVFFSSIFGLAISLLLASILPNALADRGWSGRAAWVISGIILGELVIFGAGIILFGLGKIASIQTLRDGALINWILWIVAGMPYSAIYSILLHKNEYPRARQQSAGN